MKTGKIVISFFILFTYVLGYAHTLLPHHQDIVAGEIIENHHHHNHHQHPKQVDASLEVHQHISHKNHFDRGLLDLALCLISEMEHPENDCNLDFYNLENRKLISQKKLAKSGLITVFMTVVVLSDHDVKTAKYAFENDLIYQSPTIQNTPNRGPPSFS